MPLLEGSHDDEDISVLQIGDIVALKSLGRLVEGEGRRHFAVIDLMGKNFIVGVLDSDIEVVDPPLRYENCLFQICSRTRVAAQEELVDYEAQLAHVPIESRTPSQKEMLATLRRVQKEEEEMNNNTMKVRLLVCTPIFGYFGVLSFFRTRRGKS
jgi:hypothetical protein